ncbi:hypothetical protein M3Y95_00921100 [Aphelenchoides besseyi]|nr:hypothetical protein M3Y95_00921100 [Aphelenchoides besseyi]
MIYDPKKPNLFPSNNDVVVVVSGRSVVRFRALIRYVLYISVVVAIFLIAEALYLNYSPELVQTTGFYCNDDSIRHPFVKSHLTMKGVFALALIPSFFAILLTETLRLYRNNDPDVYVPCEDGLSKSSKLITRVILFYSYLFTAVTLDVVALFICKFLVGRLRPHFIAVCQPDVGFERCNTSTYITDYRCTNDNQKLIANARMSFFSGHSSLIATSTTFLILYFQTRLQGQLKARWIVAVLYTIMIVFTLWIGYSRILDYKHHPTDVIVGFLVGVSISIVVSICVGLNSLSSLETWRKRSAEILKITPASLS